MLKSALFQDKQQWEKREKLPQENLQDLFKMAESHLEKGHYKEAEDFFITLTSSSPFEFKFWKGLAKTRQLAGHYESSLKSLSVAALLEPKDPTVHLRAAECFILLCKKSEALKALALAEKVSGNNRSVKEEILLLKKRQQGRT